MQPSSNIYDIDFIALHRATKALCVLFIISICTINAILIYIIATKPSFMFSPRCLMLISLAIGDIFLALFSLVVNARGVYEDVNIPFGTNISAQSYQTFIISFVYGVGLIIMAVESILRHKGLTPFLKRYQVLEAFGFSALPWILMLLIDLPLIMSDVDWKAEKVNTTVEEIRAKFWVSVLVPAILAVVISLVIIFVKLDQVQGNCQRSNEHIRPAYLPEEQQFSTRHFLTTSHDTGSPPPYNAQQPQHNNFNDRYNTHQHISATQNSNNNSPAATYRTPILPPANAIREKCALLFVATIYFMCVVPQAALIVSDREITVRVYMILLHSFYWLCNFRSILAPAIWIIYFVKL